MAVHLIWSPVAKADFKKGVAYIREDNPAAAASWRIALLEQVQLLVDFPEIGRVVPRQDNPAIREVIHGRYRIIYRVSSARNIVEIVRVWHSARGEPEFEK